MAEPAEPIDKELGLRAEIDSLDDGLGEPSEYGVEFDGFAGVYRKLPEFPFPAVLGADVRLRWVDGEKDPWLLRPIAIWGGNLIVRHVEEEGMKTSLGSYHMLYGSLFVPEMDVEQFGMNAVHNLVPTVVTANQPMLSQARIDDERSLRFGWSARSFCRDAMVAHAQAYTLDELGSPSVREQTSTASLFGSMITVQRTPQAQLPLFIKAQPQLTDKLANLDWRMAADGGFRPMLSFETKN